MAFRLEDFKKTTRKAAKGSGAPMAAYPQMMRDKKARERLEWATQTFDALVGKRRGTLDARVMMDFFEDPRVARGVVACLGRYYRYRTPDFAEVAGTEAAGRLADAGLAQPSDLRAHTYAYVNAAHDGFLTERTRLACFAEIGEPFGLSGQVWDTLLHLDAEENQILTRPGQIPTAADLAALYNFHSVDTPLRRATKVVLTGLHLSSTEAAAVRALARDLGARAAVTEGGAAVTLTPGEISPWLPQRPGRMGRCLLHLLQAHGSRALAGYIDAPLGARAFRVELNTERLAALGMRLPRKGASVDATPLLDGAALRRCREMLAALHEGFAKLRAQTPGLGWRVLRMPEPVVNALGVFLPDVTLQRDQSAVHLIFSETNPCGWGAPVLALPTTRRTPNPVSVLAWAEAALTDAEPTPQTTVAVPPAVQTLCDQAAKSGIVRAADAKRALHLLDETPLVEWVRLANDPRVRYVPGIGLCSQSFVAAIHGAGGA